MRIGLLIGRFPPGHVGGAELQAEQWARRLGRTHEVTVITRRYRISDPLEEERLGFRLLRTPMSRLPGWRTIADVHSTGACIDSLPARPDVLLCFQTFISGFSGVHAQFRSGVPAVVWIRGEDEYRFENSTKSKILSPRIWDRASGVLVQSRANRAALLDALRRDASDVVIRVDAKLDIVPNGIEMPERLADGRHDAVLVLGRLIRHKGVDVVIDAMADRPDVELVVAGDGPERSALQAQAIDRGVRATFLGMVERDELAGVFARARCLVMASRQGEGFPNVLLEAMAHRVPVVTTPVGGISDLVTDGRSGFLIGIDDSVTLSQAVKRLLDNDALHATIAAAGHEVASEYVWDDVQQRLERVLDRFLARPSSNARSNG